MSAAIIQHVKSGDIKALARSISMIENEAPGYEELLLESAATAVPIIGITGPPGAGKSTLVDGLIKQIVEAGKGVAVLCVDPSSPFNLGALLGDRIRMSNWYTHPNVYIRSLASRGALGGLHPKIVEITEWLKAAPFDYIITETVGVGQSEVEITGLADLTVVVVVPEAGDEVQTMKSGIMEIADLFVVNKADRPEADQFVRNLRLMLAPAFHRSQIEIPVVKTIASTGEGLGELWAAILKQLSLQSFNEHKSWLLAERAFQLIQARRMKGVHKEVIKEMIAKELKEGSFNLYQFVSKMDN